MTQLNLMKKHSRLKSALLENQILPIKEHTDHRALFFVRRQLHLQIVELAVLLS